MPTLNYQFVTDEQKVFEPQQFFKLLSYSR